MMADLMISDMAPTGMFSMFPSKSIYSAWLLFFLLLFCAVGSVLVELVCVVLIVFTFGEEEVIEFRLCVGECFFVVHSLLVE